MNCTLGSITLHPRTHWQGEFDGGDVEWAEVRTLSGKLVRQHGAKIDGRPITLVGGFFTRATLVLLRALKITATPTLLTLPDAREFLTEFADDNAIVATPAGLYYIPTDTDYFDLELNLIVVT